jgi:NCAIR mutase (PurE)-related protein
MDLQQLQRILEQVRDGDTSIDEALSRLRHLPFEDLGFAKLDHHRAIRHGMHEVILGKGKNPDQVASIAVALLAKSPNLLLTRATEEMSARVAALAPEAEYFPASGVVRVWRDRTILGKGKIAAICAGTGDIPVLEPLWRKFSRLSSVARSLRSVCICRPTRYLILNAFSSRSLSMEPDIATVSGRVTSLLTLKPSLNGKF